MDNLHSAPHAPTALNVTVAATRKRQVRRSARPREYLTEREIEKLMDAAGGNRWGHRDATAILMAYRHGLRGPVLRSSRIKARARRLLATWSSFGTWPSWWKCVVSSVVAASVLTCSVSIKTRGMLTAPS